DEATVITMDGAGDYSSSHVYRVRAGRFQPFWTVNSFNSLGNYYAYITHICGFKAQKHEGKITGLAAYGAPIYADLLRRYVTYEDGSIVNKGEVFYWAAVKALERSLPKAYERKDVASSMQQVLEDVGGAYVRHWVGKTGCGDLALAGGVFANVKFNQRIHESDGVRSVFIHPGMGDEGLAVGAAFAFAALSGPDSEAQIRPEVLADVYLGPAYGAGEIESAIREEGLQAEFVPEIERRIAELLARGR